MSTTSTSLKVNVKDVYKDFRTSDSGLLPKQKLAQALRCLGHNPLQKEVILEAKKYKGQMLDFSQFEKILGEFEKKEKVQREELEESLNIFDVDGEGWISRGQIKHLICSPTGEEALTEDEFEELLDNIQANEDGLIRVTDFAHLLNQGNLPKTTDL